LYSYKDHQILVVGRPKICATNPEWRTATILKIVKCHLSNHFTDFDEICTATVYDRLLSLSSKTEKNKKNNHSIISIKHMRWVLHLNLVIDKFKC